MQTYAKTDSAGAVIEHRINETRIRNRGHRLDMYERITPTKRPSFNPLTHTIAERKPERVGGELCQVWEVRVKPLPMLRADMTAKLADIRYQHETGGITLADGTNILTGREDQAMVAGAYQSLKSGLIPDTRWKSPTGWKTVTLTEMEPIAQAVANHVRTCFGAENAVSDQIEQAQSVDELTAIDVRAAYQSEYDATQGGQ